MLRTALSSVAPPLLSIACAAIASAAPITLELQWAALADPAGILNGPFRNGIASGESADFSRDGQYIVTVSKADGRMASPTGSPHDGTAHMRLFDIQGNLIWDVKRSRGPLNPATGRPVDQPASGVDEMENAAFSRDDVYVAAGGDDAKVEIWQVRDLSTHAILPQPILVRTFNTGGGVDSLRYSHDGSLLLVGTEEAGKVEIFRVQGDPGTWQFMHKANHGGTGANSVNSVDISQNDRYVATGGTNTNGGFWRLDVTRDGTGLVTNVNMVRLTTMTHPGSTNREARIQPNVDPAKALISITAEHDWATYVYSAEELLAHGNPGSSPAPIQILRNNHPSNTQNMRGTPTESATFTEDGRFLMISGKTRDIPTTPQTEIGPAFIRIYETKELLKGRPEPDPVYVQSEGVFNPEFLGVNGSNTQLSSSHHDGSVRLWNIHITEAETIASEAFNESTNLANRWTLSGPRATTDGSTPPSGTKSFGTSNHVNTVSAFVGHRGSQYLSMRHLGETTHTLTLNETWDLSGYENLQVQFAAAAATGQFEGSDLLRLRADFRGTGIFDTVVAEFRPDANSNMVLSGSNLFLTTTFTDFFIDLAPLLPPDFNHSVRFQVEAWNSSANEPMAFDSLRVTGTVVPEPGSALMLGASATLLGLRRLRRRNPESAREVQRRSLRWAV